MATTRQTRNSGSTNRAVVEHSALFSGGLNTEVSDTIDAIPYTSDECNCEIRPNGTRSRRLGIDYERGAKLFLLPEAVKDSMENAAVSSFEWVEVKDKPGQSFIVVQVGLYLFFFENKGAPYSSRLVLTQDGQSALYLDCKEFLLEDYSGLEKIPDECYKEPFKFTEAYGRLFVCGRYIQPFCLSGLEPPEQGIEISHTTPATATMDVSSINDTEVGRQYYTERSFRVGSGRSYFTAPKMAKTYKDTVSGYLGGGFRKIDIHSVEGGESGNEDEYSKKYKLLYGHIGLFKETRTYKDIAYRYIYYIEMGYTGMAFEPEITQEYLGWLDYDTRNSHSWTKNVKVIKGKPVEALKESELSVEMKHYFNGSSASASFNFKSEFFGLPSETPTTETGDIDWDKKYTIVTESYTVRPIDDFAEPAFGDFKEQSASATNTYMKTAHYYARVWNALPVEITHGITCSALTDFEGEEATSYDDNEFLLFEGDTADLNFSKIYMNEIYKFNKTKKGWYGEKSKEVVLRGFMSYSEAHGLNLCVRDFEGVSDIQEFQPASGESYKVDYRSGNGISSCPQKRTPEHLYNLYNQGWMGDSIEAFYNDDETQEKIGYKDADSNLLRAYPANNMQWFVAKKDFEDTDASVREFKPAELLNTAFGSSIAPRGHFIIKFFKQDRAKVSDLPLSEDSQKEVSKPRFNYVTDILAYAGRIFYLVGDTLLYSQVVVEDFSKADKCYQEADPTSETISDIVDTDGGSIALPEIGVGIRLCISGGSLCVVGSRGTAFISGGSESMFSATNYTSFILMTTGSVSPNSFVNTEEGLFYWSITGVARLQTSSQGVSFEIVSKGNIQTVFDNIPEACIRKCLAVYDRPSKQISWMYPDEDDPDNLVNILRLDIRSGLWTKHRVVKEEAKTSEVDGKDYSVVPKIKAAISLGESFKTQNEYYVYCETETGTEPVCISGESDEEVSYILAEEPLESEKVKYTSVLYLVKNKDGITFAVFNNNNYKDWAKADTTGSGYNYESYLVSHPILLQREYQNKTTPYLLTTFRRTEQGFDLLGNGIHPSACQGSVMWDWPENGNSGKWDAQQELYRYDKGSILDGKMVSSKTRIYGSGRALQIRLSSVANKGFIVENVGLQVYVDGRI